MTARTPRPRLATFAALAAIGSLAMTGCSGDDGKDSKAEKSDDSSIGPAAEATTREVGDTQVTDLSAPREFDSTWEYATALYAGLGQYLLDNGSYPETLDAETLAAANAPQASNMTIAQYTPSGAKEDGDAAFFKVCITANDGTEFTLFDTAEPYDLLVGEGDSCDRGDAVPFAEAQATNPAQPVGKPSEGASKTDGEKNDAEPAVPSVPAPDTDSERSASLQAARAAVEEFLQTVTDKGYWTKTSEGVTYRAPAKSADKLKLPDGVVGLEYYRTVQSPNAGRIRPEFCVRMNDGAWGAFYDPDPEEGGSRVEEPITAGLSGTCGD